MIYLLLKLHTVHAPGDAAKDSDTLFLFCVINCFTLLSYLCSNMSYAYIMLFFKEDQFISLKRAELFGITDFIANVGGLLGLFMGVSLLSIVEIIYFCTIRWIYRLKAQRRHRSQLLNGSEIPPAASPSPTITTDIGTQPGRDNTNGHHNISRKHLRRY